MGRHATRLSGNDSGGGSVWTPHLGNSLPCIRTLREQDAQ